MERIKIDDIYDNPYLSVRLHSFLYKFDYLDEWTNLTANEVLELHGIGRKNLRDIRKFLAMYGLALKDDVIFDNESDKKLLMDVPNQIKEINNLLREVDKNVRRLTDRLDQLHCNMQPNHR